MKMKDIIEGQEYAYSYSKYSSNPFCVRVLEKGVSYYDAKGRGVRVEHEDGDVEIVLGTRMRSTWAEWEAKKAKMEKIHSADRHARIRMEALSDKLKCLFERKGIEASVNWYTKSINVKLDEESAKKLLELLRTRDESAERYEALAELAEQGQALDMGYEG